MAISFKDFQGKYLDERGFISDPDLEPIDGAVDSANQWIAENSVEVINVETVFTNLGRESECTLQFEGDRAHFRKTQIIRVWYLDSIQHVG